MSSMVSTVSKSKSIQPDTENTQLWYAGYKRRFSLVTQASTTLIIFHDHHNHNLPNQKNVFKASAITNNLRKAQKILALFSYCNHALSFLY